MARLPQATKRGAMCSMKLLMLAESMIEAGLTDKATEMVRCVDALIEEGDNGKATK